MTNAEREMLNAEQLKRHAQEKADAVALNETPKELNDLAIKHQSERADLAARS